MSEPSPAEWSIVPREKDLTRLYDPLSKWEKLVLVERHLTPHTWTVTGPVEALAVFQPGSGCILDRNGEQVASGRMIDLASAGTVVGESTKESVTVTFASDLVNLGHRIIFPTPSQNLTTAISKFTSSYDLRSGAIETLIIGFIRSHMGNLAQLDRQLPRLRFPTDLARGGSTQVSGRLDNLGVLVQTLAEAGGLKVDLVHTEDVGGAWLDLKIDVVNDLSDNVRFGTPESSAGGLVSEWAYRVGLPTTTRAIVAGGGELSDREFLQIDSTPPEVLWNVAVETLVDQRQVAPESVDKAVELTRAGEEAIEQGQGPLSVSFVPILGSDQQYRRDIKIGDIVGYDLPRLDPAKDKIREATTTVTLEAGQPMETVQLVVGTPDAPTTRSQQQVARALRSVTVLQRS